MPIYINTREPAPPKTQLQPPPPTGSFSQPASLKVQTTPLIYKGEAAFLYKPRAQGFVRAQGTRGGNDIAIRSPWSVEEGGLLVLLSGLQTILGSLCGRQLPCTLEGSVLEGLLRLQGRRLTQSSKMEGRRYMQPNTRRGSLPFGERRAPTVLPPCSALWRAACFNCAPTLLCR